MKQSKQKKVLCHFCKKPIHINKLGGVYKQGKKEVWICDNEDCLLKVIEELYG